MGGDPLKDQSVEELTCLALAKMWDEEDVYWPWDWKRQYQQQIEPREGHEERDNETKGDDL